jgi:hypothetical protein
MRSQFDLDAYEVAYLCGGPERVAMVVLVGLYEVGRISVSADRHRVHAVRRSSDDGVQAAALEVIPEVGRVLGLTVQMIAASPAIHGVGRELREKRVMPSSRLSVVWQWGRARTARDLRRRMAKASPAEPLECVAVMGAAGIADDGLRQIFDTHVYEPPVSIKLTGLRVGGSDPLHSTGTPDWSSSLNAAANFDARGF